LEDLLKLANNLGAELNLTAEEEIKPNDYQNLTRIFSASTSVKVLNYLLQETLKLVRYSSHPLPHFGLAYPSNYTHCLSPYKDMLIFGYNGC
jgi:ribonuclease R